MIQTKQTTHTSQKDRGFFSYREIAEIERALARILRKHGLPVDEGAVGGMTWHHLQLWQEQRTKQGLCACLDILAPSCEACSSTW